MPVTQQFLALGLGDLGNLHEGGQLASLKDVLWQDVPSKVAGRSLEDPMSSTTELRQPKRFAIDRLGGKNNPLTHVADGPVSLVRLRAKCLMGLSESMFVPNNGRTPFVATFDVTSSTKARHVDEQRAGCTLSDHQSEHAVFA
jgi:hypothetical protein